MFFGKLKDTQDEWGFYISPERFESSIQISDAEHMNIISAANSSGKLIKGDKDGKPILVNPPEPSQKEKATQKIREAENYLSQTDWYVLRFIETGKEIPFDIKNKRQEARDEISRLITIYPKTNTEEQNEEYSELGSNTYDENGNFINHTY